MDTYYMRGYQSKLGYDYRQLYKPPSVTRVDAKAG